MNTQLLEKYNISAPRYTSYPTVPFWQSPPDISSWKQKVKAAFERSREISVYIHLPFCERLCTYCGCNKRITKNHAVEQPYIKALLQEWQMYKDILGDRPIIKQLHLGGGTPTFFSPIELQKLIATIFEDAYVPKNADISFEAHPNSTSFEHLSVLRSLGFNRLSIGVQDFDQEILRIINRFQTDQQIETVTSNARKLGYTSINYDLIFGLPRQTTEHIELNMERLATLRPDRLAFYSYAHVPWIKPSQRAYSVEDLPVGAEKRKLYELGRQLLENQGYTEIGLDHFALPSDDLYQAMQEGTLYRNFMGYTPFSTQLSIGLGASSISDSWDGYIQNEKKVETYQNSMAKGEWNIIRGHDLTAEDQAVKEQILNIMCRFETSWSPNHPFAHSFEMALDRLDELVNDGLVQRNPFGLIVTPEGRPFIRNIAMAFDSRYWEKEHAGNLFSQVV